MKDDKTYIKNILDSIQKIEEFTKGINKGNFVENQMMQSATILQLALIGEEANKISKDTKSKIDLAWKEIIGFRNMAFHDYINLEIDIVWDTVQEDLPELKAKLSEYK
ncbi:MAG: HepT-like ribonuclease domain-containing protein [Patescibacteria group bacterium]